MVEDSLSGVMALEVVFDGPDFDSLMDPQRLRALQRVQAWLDERPEVDYSLSLPDLIAEMHWAFNGEDPAFRNVPENANLIAQYLLIYDGRELYEMVNRDFTRARMALNLNAHGAGELNGLMQDLNEELKANPPADLTWDYAGMGRLFADQERLLIQGQIDSVKVVVVLGAGAYAGHVALGQPGAGEHDSQPRTGGTDLRPDGDFGIWLDMATAMVASVAVGIALDDTIHILHGYVERRNAGCSSTWAIARTLRQRGRAVIGNHRDTGRAIHAAGGLRLSAHQHLRLADGDRPGGSRWCSTLLVLPAILIAARNYLPTAPRPRAPVSSASP